MGRLKNFIGSIFIGSGMKPKGNYPLIEAYDILVDYDEEGNEIRLDAKLESISSGNIQTDTSLSKPGMAADAAKVGEILGDIHTRLKNI